MTVSTGTRDSEFQYGEDVDVLRSPGAVRAPGVAIPGTLSLRCILRVLMPQRSGTKSENVP